MALGRFPLVLALAACGGASPAIVSPAPPPPAPAPHGALPVASPSLPPAPLPPAPPALSPAERALATHRALFEALHARDANALAALYAPEASIDLGETVATAKGPDAVATLATALWTAFPDAKVQWSTLVQSGDAMAVELAWTGTQLGALGDRAPTKRVIGTAALLLETFTPDGLLASQRLYFDADSIATDLAPRTLKPRSFVGLPTRQTTVREATELSAEDVAVRGRLSVALESGALEDLAGLGSAASTWLEATKRHVTEGKGAVPAWLAFETRARTAASRPALLIAGNDVVETWDGPSGVAEVIVLQAGHIATVHTYRRMPIASRR